MKTTLLFASFFLCFNLLQAQSHNLAQFSECRFVKRIKRLSSEGMQPCYACKELRDKETAAIKVENKRRLEADIAKTKADQIARQNAFDEKQRLQLEENKKPKSGEVLINGDLNTVKTPVTEKKPPIKGIDPNTVYMLSFQSNGFLNAVTSAAIPMPAQFKYEAVQGAYMQTEGVENAIKEQYSISQNKFPANTGVVKLYQEVNQENHPLFQNSYSAIRKYRVHDIINEKQQRLFNSDSICFIEHLYGNWFFIGYNFFNNTFGNLTFESAKLYNIKSKEYITITEKDYLNRIFVLTIKGHGRERNMVGNYRFIKGIYREFYMITPGNAPAYKSVYKRSKADEMIDAKLGGPDKWKAFLAIRPISGKSDITSVSYVYYCDENENIKKITLSAQERNSMY